MKASWTVFCKELLDALRDRRTLLTVLFSSVAMGPVMLFAMSQLVGSMERWADQRTVFLVGAEQAPTLVNYLQRQSFEVQPAPPGYEELLARSKLGDPVVVVPADFEAQLAAGEVPTLDVVANSANNRAQSGMRRVSRLLQGFAQEQAMLHMMARGVSPSMLESVDVQERDLANPQARAAQLMGMVPFFVLMAVLYGAMTAALDTTAGERERGSLEPLLLNPAARLSLVLGKWGAVACVGMMVALLSCMSFLPAQALMRSESLAAMFQFGGREMAWFLALLAPLACAMAAMMMAIAIRTKSFKEAQANTTVVIMVVSMLPLVQLFGQEGESPWHLTVPALGQITLMNRVLKGEVVAWGDWLLTLLVCGLIVAICLSYVTRMLRRAAVR
jgi:sodium transport system permease protein